MRFKSYRDYKLPNAKRPAVGLLVLEHRPFSEYARVKFPDGDDEVVLGVDLPSYLEFIGVKDADKMSDRVWNFYKLTIKIDTSKQFPAQQATSLPAAV
jgi:hypothetical protein